ncbi:FkbM family methyltransferase [Conexibacter sp. JD483]|uniref:FkbM family methyltransferase n=1 Tax=unclassified Conexibacter TaxID=2627773 RepID=UPI002716BEBE|nr:MULTISPECIES: FkbM family methyltransferase [unclassified Conexibacter]MDO8184236.1 FkbM family methyltransferase [Conexibacter sp. CPCC 205706]MDO8197228.1 FkbM family methyltransferase [Conexibacter sp. CPCC 205762]MDR9367457.1 FkbM family methyltransferase [Conexibacter sp. JD483]
MAPASTRTLGSRLLTAHAWEDVRSRAPYRVARLIEGAAICSDVASLRRWLATRPSGPRQLVELRLRPLGGERFRIRSGTADVWALPDTFLPADHLPPPEIDPAGVRLIWDLGANVGSSMAHLATVCQQARVIGVELDGENAELCRTNIAPWTPRAELLNAAVWIHDGEVRYARDGGDELSFHIDEDADPTGAEDTVPAFSLDTLLAQHGGGAIVDYVKMDIEGAEQRVLREQTGWARHVRSIKVEVHEPYGVEDCVADLRRLGFRAWPDSKHTGRTGKPPVIGVRDDAVAPPAAAPAPAGA